MRGIVRIALGASLGSGAVAADPVVPPLNPPVVEVIPAEPFPSTPQRPFLAAEATTTAVEPTVTAPYTPSSVPAVTSVPTAVSSDCSTGHCAPSSTHHRGNALERVAGWFGYKPAAPVVRQFQPEPHHPSLMRYFPCHTGLGGAGCGNGAGSHAVLSVNPASPVPYTGLARVSPSVYPLGRLPIYEVPADALSDKVDPQEVVPTTPTPMPPKATPPADRLLQSQPSVSGTPRLSRMGPPANMFPTVVTAPFANTNQQAVNGVVTSTEEVPTARMPNYRQPGNEIIPVDGQTAPRKNFITRAVEVFVPPVPVPANPYATPQKPKVISHPSKAVQVPGTPSVAAPEYPTGPVGFPSR